MNESMNETTSGAQIFRNWNEVEYVEALFAAAAAALLIAVVKFVVPKVTSWVPDRFRFWILPWEPILRLLILVSAVLYITPLFVQPTAENLLAIGGALAVALGFAFKDYASSLIAGVVALYERPYRPGDWIKIGDTYGEVQSLGLRTVQLLTPDDTRVAVPHLKMWSSAIYNSNGGVPELMCVADYYVDSEHDGDVVTEALRDVAWTSPYTHLDRRVVVVAAEEPWGTHYRLKAYPIDGRDQFAFLTDLTIRGKALLQRHGVRPCGARALGPQPARTLSGPGVS